MPRTRVRRFVIGTYAIACIAFGRTVLADEKQQPSVPLLVAPKVEPQVKLVTVPSSDRGVAFADFAPNAQFQGYVTLFGPLVVKATNAAGQPVALVPLVFNCHVAAGWACQIPQGSNKADTITILTNQSGLAQIGADPGLYVSATPSQSAAATPAPGPGCAPEILGREHAAHSPLR